MTESPALPAPDQSELLARLAELRDVELPVPVSAWPPAPGWWILAGLAVLGLFVALRLLAARRTRGLYRKDALDALCEARARWEADGDVLAYASTTDQLIRRVAIHLLGREAVARRTGEAFVELANSLSSQALSSPTTTILSETRYRRDPTFDVESVHREVEEWLAALVEPKRA